MKSARPKLTPPFFANTPDDTHCYQAVLRSCLKYFLPDQDFSWEELDKLTAKVEDKWTWPAASMLWLLEHDFEIRDVGTFDYERFVAEGEAYLLEHAGQEKGSASIARSDIPQEIALIKEIHRKYPKTAELRVTEMTELERYIDDGWLVICSVNAGVLRDKPGYIGHFVLVFDYDDSSFTLHDPGPPPHEGWTISKALFEKAWAYPNEEAKGYIAIKYRGGQHD